MARVSLIRSAPLAPARRDGRPRANGHHIGSGGVLESGADGGIGQSGCFCVRCSSRSASLSNVSPHTGHSNPPSDRSSLDILGKRGSGDKSAFRLNKSKLLLIRRSCRLRPTVGGPVGFRHRIRGRPGGRTRCDVSRCRPRTSGVVGDGLPVRRDRDRPASDPTTTQRSAPAPPSLADRCLESLPARRYRTAPSRPATDG